MSMMQVCLENVLGIGLFGLGYLFEEEYCLSHKHSPGNALSLYYLHNESYIFLQSSIEPYDHVFLRPLRFKQGLGSFANNGVDILLQRVDIYVYLELVSAHSSLFCSADL